MELKGKMKGCMSENEMFLQWGELRKGKCSSSKEMGFLNPYVHLRGKGTFFLPSLAFQHR